MIRNKYPHDHQLSSADNPNQVVGGYLCIGERMGNRKAISKKDRFEIFKRDGFTCQYCGLQPPEVVLHVDHIVPVSKGGNNDPMNLITACRECNQGKAAKPLEQISPKPDADLEWLQMQQEIVELRRYQLAKEERDKLTEMIVLQLQDTWATLFEDDYVLCSSELKRWLSWAEPLDIENAIEISSIKRDTFNSWDHKLRYTAGILHNICKQESEE